jgi:hypothetical protein
MSYAKGRNEAAATRFEYKQSIRDADAWKTPISDKTVDKLIAMNTAGLLRETENNALVYAYARQALGQSAKPQQIISDVGFKDHKFRFNWTYIAPSVGEYEPFPKRQGPRPWKFIFVHSFGYTWDVPYLMRFPTALHPPGDEYGHHPMRWRSGIAQLVTPKKYDPAKPNKSNKVSIHFCISRRGDILVSVDLNDIAYHGGGDPRYDIGKLLKNALGPWRGSNVYTIGIELEPCLGRLKPNKSLVLLDYPDRQLQSFAVLIKKLQAIQPIANTVISRFKKASLEEQLQVAATTGGYIQHLDTFPIEKRLNPKTGKLESTGKSDASNQRDANDKAQMGVYSDGSVGPGWTKLFEHVAALKSFDLAKNVFVDHFDSPDFSHLPDLAVAMNQGNVGQRAALGALMDHMAGYKRAAGMAAMSRRTLNSNAVTQAADSHNALAKIAASASKISQSVGTSSLTPISGPDLAYEEDTDTWTAGGEKVSEGT